MTTQKITNRHAAGVTLRRLHKSFGAVDVLHDISLQIAPGEFVVFVGPSGCGKSTLLRLIAGLEHVTAGDVFIGDTDVTEKDPSDRGIAMVFQTYALYPHMSVGQNMGFGLKAAGRPKAEIAQKVSEAAAVLKLTDYLDRKPGQLSGGQRQRVAIGRAIVRNPDVFLFDEPLSNLDAELRVGMRLEIARLHRELGITMIYVTHDQTEAMTLADKIVVLRAGRVEQVGAPADLYEDPDNIFVAGFIGSPAMNFFPAVMGENGQITVAGNSIPGPALTQPPAAGSKVTLGLRPEHLEIVTETTNPQALTFHAEFTEYLGGSSYCYGTLGDGLPCTLELPRNRKLRASDRTQISVDPSQMRIFDRDGLRIR
ncbi:MULTISPECIES: sn-glycerol-3-phosphate ABC transporter ATP-binding protein UgpC [unclassified Yoonia]|uniref:ABC transporter ATP-binding protein n=1 Tax=unclassified Yoonia TaxID=2629118 RepID=UPI002AFE5973|nr:MULTISPECIES: sn-glycerol-3-phosphate ABC transporter ATP-binding protein UgpC [unclassified Yoonia]